MFLLKLKTNPKLKICDPAEGPSGGAGGPPVTELAVLPRPHEVLASTIVGVLIEGPVALHDIAGVDVAATEVILDRLTVIIELHHLALEVGTLIDTDAIWAFTGLKAHSDGKYKMSHFRCCLTSMLSFPPEFLSCYFSPHFSCVLDRLYPHEHIDVT